MECCTNDFCNQNSLKEIRRMQVQQSNSSFSNLFNFTHLASTTPTLPISAATLQKGKTKFCVHNL